MREAVQEAVPLPEDEEQEPRNRFNKRLLIGLGVVALAAAYLIFLALDAAGAVYMEADEALAAGQDAYGRRLRLGGTVALESVQRGPDGLEVRFALDGTSADVPVVYHGALPDIFGEGVTVFVEGKFTDDGIFQANVLLARHPDTMDLLEPGDAKPPQPS